MILETECDIQQKNVADNGGFLQSTYMIYFPFDKEAGISIKRGMRFEGSMYGLAIKGTINEPFPTQMGGCEVSIKDLEV